MITVADVLPRMEQRHRDVLNGMLAKAGIPLERSVYEVVKMFTYGTDLYKHLSFDEKKALLPLMTWDKDKFQAKLTYAQRCEILAMHRTGITRELLARAYGVNRRTVTHIYNPTSIHYRDVREEERRVGQAAFQEHYLTQRVIDHVMAFRQMGEQGQIAANKAANRKSGPHTVRGNYTKLAHRIVVAWKDKGDPASPDGTAFIEVSGWYYNDLDGDFPNFWTYVDEDSLKSSDACYRAMLSEIQDKETGIDKMHE